MKKNTKIMLWLFFLIIAAVQLFPFIWLVNFSFTSSSEFYSSSILKWPDAPQWQNYINAWVDGKFARYFFNSFFVTAVTIVLTVVLSLTLGYAFTRMQWKLRSLFFTVILLGIMIPIHATLLPNFAIFKSLGLTDSYLGLILPYTAVSVPLGTFMLTGFLRSIPKAMEESAVIDGANIYRIVFGIIAPLTAPALVTIVVTTFLNCWNEFIMASTFLSKDSLKTLPFSVMNFTGQYSSDYGSQFAVMVLTSVPAIIIYAIFNEQITKGVTAGAVKG
ncbi:MULTISPECIES: carbohydrate ABC transporter permease [Paenibacillus]|uniref:carbohydrate ABC transporter permease n=1 Tax=Paenibacillus TaxID=44249 RepID=UPI0004F7410C|nr:MULTISPECIES: carbohydrate ABC transporter permease [Paenibacillus]AIQ46616.1 sugar ABC transporter permease [Paenibacillus sp. FSL R7-0273]MDF9842565.1 raffinose/stachyose/melibiose transport system permease protein [Paenibacillus sp. PastF-2]MDF9849228.1 raffinose/stachyose/melibiose transport system permease protein [Paenibacillus sp. PastM-2]MDF9855725.1 raffinose/stachyose/melibiose transport system permease protein [Paenibacillus sp. PastF-1]MDH6481070.1 raffinose/stachyose/melibiose 